MTEPHMSASKKHSDSSLGTQRNTVKVHNSRYKEANSNNKPIKITSIIDEEEIEVSGFMPQTNSAKKTNTTMYSD